MKLLLVILTVLSLIVSGLIFSVMWGWFIVPLGVVPLSVAHAIGIQSLIFFAFIKTDQEKRLNTEELLESLITAWIVKWGITFGIAWIAYLNM